MQWPNDGLTPIFSATAPSHGLLGCRWKILKPIEPVLVLPCFWLGCSSRLASPLRPFAAIRYQPRSLKLCALLPVASSQLLWQCPFVLAIQTGNKAEAPKTSDSREWHWSCAVQRPKLHWNADNVMPGQVGGEVGANPVQYTEPVQSLQLIKHN